MNNIDNISLETINNAALQILNMIDNNPKSTNIDEMNLALALMASQACKQHRYREEKRNQWIFRLEHSFN